MGRLTRLVDLAKDDRHSLAETLRHAKVVSFELGVGDLTSWVRYELNGYDSKEKLPSYRISQGFNLGNYLDPVRRITHMPIPMHVLPDDMQEEYSQLQIYQGIDSIEELLERDKDDGIQAPWPSPAITLLNHHYQETLGVGQHAGFMTVWQKVPRIALVRILSAVRDRLLDFALELRAANPELDVTEAKPTPQQQEQARQLFQTYVYSDQAVVAAGQDITQTVSQSLDSVEDLIKYLETLGVSEPQALALRQAIRQDRDAQEQGVGTKVREWIGDMSATAVGTALGSQLPAIIAAVERYVSRGG